MTGAADRDTHAQTSHVDQSSIEPGAELYTDALTVKHAENPLQQAETVRMK